MKASTLRTMKRRRARIEACNLGFILVLIK